MARRLLTAILYVFVASLGTYRTVAHDIITTNLTYTRDISRIFERRCVSCHGASATIPLTTYAQVRPWAVDIKEQVLSRQMPPWGAVKGFGRLSPDEGLTQEELLILAAWVVGGAPQGSPALLPSMVAKQPSAEASTLPSLHDSLVVKDRVRVDRQLSLMGIRPLGNSVIDSARITLALPDGEVRPLLWLFHYDPNWKQVFRFQAPVEIAAGTSVQSDSALQFALEVR